MQLGYDKSLWEQLVMDFEEGLSSDFLNVLELINAINRVYQLREMYNNSLIH